MSFSKAKLQRFNDIKVCTPSPAKYNVLSQERVKCGIISKPGTYVKGQSPHSSEAGSIHSTPCFQTPTVPQKRKKLLGMSFKSSKSEKLTSHEELRDKIVECNNKDLYIKDLTDQIEEMTGRLNNLKKECTRLESERNECEGALSVQREQNKAERIRREKQYKEINNNVTEVNLELRHIRQKHQDLRSEQVVLLSKILASVDKFEELNAKSVQENREELERKICEFRKNEEENLKRIVQLETREREHKEKEEGYLKRIKELETQCVEIEALKRQNILEKEEILKKLDNSEAKVLLLEDNLKDVNILMEMQTNQKLQEVEETWKQKLEDKEKESNAILKECQEISEYNIIQCEIEKNFVKEKLEEAEKSLQEILTKNKNLEEEVNNLKTEKHAYLLSITTFKDTIEVLKKRLINSDRDVEQLKEELEKCEEKILNYERKCTELSAQLSETQNANEELEMQYESTSKLMHSRVKAVEADLLQKVEALKEQVQTLARDKELLSEVLDQHHEQQELISGARLAVSESASLIASLEKQHAHLEAELGLYKLKAEEEAEDAAEIRKKYIEKSGKYDELAQQFEQILQELDQAKAKIDKLEKEAEELGTKYAQLLSHQNHQQKVKHVRDLKVKSSEMFQKNLDLESKNYKLNALVEKLMKEVDDLRKPVRKGKVEDKENVGSPKCVKGIQSPGPLKDKN